MKPVNQMKKKYDYTFKLRLMKKDREKLFQDAENANLSASEYIRRLINNKRPYSREDIGTIKELIHEVNAIGVNINQIAKHFNSDFFSENEKRKLFAYMQQLIKNTEEIIGRDSKR